jgi:hypothetical protein
MGYQQFKTILVEMESENRCQAKIAWDLTLKEAYKSGKVGGDG